MYDVRNDPGEKHNLKHREKAKFNEIYKRYVDLSKGIPPWEGRNIEKSIFKRGLRNNALTHGWCSPKQ